jgi:hypothetical protein
MDVLIVGAKGNMGNRYSVILRHLGRSPVRVDLPWPAVVPDWRYAIVATPTDAHLESIYQLVSSTPDETQKRFVLIEKPVTKSMSELYRIKDVLDKSNMQLNCVNQYNYLPEVVRASKTGPSWYSYYKHGKDGLWWDCFQIMALAKKEAWFDAKSPWWDCVINGERIDIKHMDLAYVEMISDWLGPQKRVWGWDTIEKTTLRILDNL